jgi:hypothetical protein
MGKWPNCTIDSCGKPHHEMLHEVLKEGKPSVPAKKTESQSGPPAAAAGRVPAPTLYLKRELLEGHGIDPDTLEVWIRVQGPGEQERPPGTGSAVRSAAREMGGRNLSGKLLEAFSLLCQAGERFVSYMGENRQQAAGPTDSVEASEEAAPEDRGGLEALGDLETTCTRFNTSTRRRTCSSAGPGTSQQLEILPSLNSKEFFSGPPTFPAAPAFPWTLIFHQTQGF